MNETRHKIFEDAFNILCGDKLGSGSYRDVYECRIDKSLVVKVEYGEYRDFHNFLEYAFWNQHQNDRTVARWLAPCTLIANDARILLQKRVAPARMAELPAELPGFITDVKLENLGFLAGRIVCCDYAFTNRDPDTKLKKIDWELELDA